MENKEIRINVRIGTMDLFSFMLYHTYTNLSGLFGLGLSLLSFAMLIGGFAAGDTVKTIILLVLGLLFTVVNPMMLFVKSKQQAMNNPATSNMPNVCPSMVHFISEREVYMNTVLIRMTINRNSVGPRLP